VSLVLAPRPHPADTPAAASAGRERRLGPGLTLLPGSLRAVARDADVYANLMQHLRPEPAQGAIGAPQEARVLTFLRDRRAQSRPRSPLLGAAHQGRTSSS